MEIELTQQKKQIRKEVTARLKAMPEQQRAAASAVIQERVLETAEYRNAQTLLLYLHMPTEPDTDRIICKALKDGKTVCVPKCVSKTEMIAVRIRDFSDLAPGAYGILEPIDCSETLEPDALDCILVPCVAASADGRRLGHGAGYYDRFLAGNADKTVCVCFAAALRDDIPMGENDLLMHRVITEA